MPKSKPNTPHRRSGTPAALPESHQECQIMSENVMEFENSHIIEPVQDPTEDLRHSR